MASAAGFTITSTGAKPDPCVAGHDLEVTESHTDGRIYRLCTRCAFGQVVVVVDGKAQLRTMTEVDGDDYVAVLYEEADDDQPLPVQENVEHRQSG